MVNLIRLSHHHRYWKVYLALIDLLIYNVWNLRGKKVERKKIMEYKATWHTLSIVISKLKEKIENNHCYSNPSIFIQKKRTYLSNKITSTYLSWLFLQTYLVFFQSFFVLFFSFDQFASVYCVNHNFLLVILIIIIIIIFLFYFSLFLQNEFNSISIHLQNKSAY